MSNGILANGEHNVFRPKGHASKAKGQKATDIARIHSCKNPLNAISHHNSNHHTS